MTNLDVKFATVLIDNLARWGSAGTEAKGWENSNFMLDFSTGDHLSKRTVQSYVRTIGSLNHNATGLDTDKQESNLTYVEAVRDFFHSTYFPPMNSKEQTEAKMQAIIDLPVLQEV